MYVFRIEVPQVARHVVGSPVGAVDAAVGRFKVGYSHDEYAVGLEQTVHQLPFVVELLHMLHHVPHGDGVKCGVGYVFQLFGADQMVYVEVLLCKTAGVFALFGCGDVPAYFFISWAKYPVPEPMSSRCPRLSSVALVTRLRLRRSMKVRAQWYILFISPRRVSECEI